MSLNPNSLKFLSSEIALALAPDIFGGLNIFTTKFNGTKERGAIGTVPVAAAILGEKNPTEFLGGNKLSYAPIPVDYYYFPYELDPSDYNNGVGVEAVTEAIMIGLRNTLIDAAISQIVQSSPVAVDDLSGLNLAQDGGFKTLLANAEFLAATVPQSDRNSWQWRGDRLESGAFGWDVIQKIPSLIASLTADAVSFTREKALAAWAVPVVPDSVKQMQVDLGLNGLQIVLTEKADELKEVVTVSARILAGFKFFDAKAYSKTSV